MKIWWGEDEFNRKMRKYYKDEEKLKDLRKEFDKLYGELGYASDNLASNNVDNLNFTDKGECRSWALNHGQTIKFNKYVPSTRKLTLDQKFNNYLKRRAKRQLQKTMSAVIFAKTPKQLFEMLNKEEKK